MNKFLGQHFLINKEKLRKIVDALELEKNDTIIEIGPGHGELTEEFRIKNLEFRVIAIEKDKRLAENLEKKFASKKNIGVIQGDALKILPQLAESCKLKAVSYKLAGNIPFYITGRLLRLLSELENKPRVIVLTIQKEVAERICVQPPQMNLLAASVQFWAEPKIVDYISKTDFRPKPKVESAIIRLRIKNYELEIMDNYYKLIKALFKQPRKTILNNLLEADKRGLFKIKNGLTQNQKNEIAEKITALGVKPEDRPQNLTVNQIIRMLELK